MERTLRIAVCNLQTGIGTTRGYWHYLTTAWKYVLPHGSRALLRAADFLREQDIDIAALCEVGGGSRRTRAVDQVAFLSEAASLPERAFFPTLVLGSRVNQGNGICSRYPVRMITNHALPGAGEPRFMSEAEIRIGAESVHLFVTHLSLEQRLRSPQIDHIARLLRKRTSPTILAGDFNISAPAELELLHEGDLTQAVSAATYPSWSPKKHLDHLFFSEHFLLQESDAFDQFRFSDHLPFVVQVAL